MKKTNFIKLALCLGLTFFGSKLNAQTQEWAFYGGGFIQDMTTDHPSDVAVIGNKSYYVQDSSGFIRVMKHTKNGDYLPITTAFPNGSGLQALELNVDVIGDKIYIIERIGGQFKSFVFNSVTNSISTIAFPYFFTSEPNWETKVAGNTLFLATIHNSIFVQLVTLDASTDTWTSNTNIYSVLNNSSVDLTINTPKIIMYTNATDIYIGLAGSTVSTLGKGPISNPSLITYYNTSGSNNGRIYLNGAITGGGAYFLAGDGVNIPTLEFYDAVTKKTYEKNISTLDINIQTASDPNIPFNVGNEDYDVVSLQGFGTAIVSNIADVGSNVFNRYNLMLKNDLTNTWDSLTTSLALFSTLQDRTISLVPNANLNHYYVKVQTTSGQSIIYTIDRKAEIDLASVTTNTGNCQGAMNQFISNVTIRDYDGDYILGMTPVVVPATPDKHMVLLSADSTSIPSVFHYAIYGTPANTGTYNFWMAVVDGYANTNTPLPSVNVTTAGTPISFLQSSNIFCDNIEDVDLANLVNIYNQGEFSVNGSVIPGTIMHIPDYIASGATSGTLHYESFFNGCLANTTAGYTIPTTGTITIATTVASCGASDGTATMTFTPGTSPMNTFEWSTGENTATITGLTSGSYYCEVIDNLGCKKREYITVDPNGISVTGATTNVDCFGNNSGAVNLTITGMTPTSFTWSNGQTTQNASGLVAGTYSVIIEDASGCQITRNFDITEPNQLLLNMTPVSPGCGLTNGSIMASVAGGVSPYTYNWVGQAATTNLLLNVASNAYTLIVTDANGCTIQKTKNLNDMGSPELTATIHNTDCNAFNGAIGLNSNSPSIIWSNGNTTNNPLGLDAGMYTVRVATNLDPVSFNQCYSAGAFTVGINGPQIQDICVVTVDTATTTNFVVWEKVDTAGVISHYNIYRETANSGQFLLIDTVNYSNLSQYNDLVASATDGSWRYRISSVNTCGVEGPQSPTHKTLVLNGYGSTTPGDFNVYWDDYEGTASVSEYVVWRHTNTTGWQALTPSVPIGVSVFTDNLPVDTVGLDYFVETVLSAPCTAAKANDFNSSRSNRQNGIKANGNSNGIKGNAIDNSMVYPNPFENKLMVELSKEQETSVEVMDITGKIIYTTVIFSTTEIELVGLNSGMYFVRLSSEGKSKVLQVVKN
jgi:Secretion system C-terminal sorting domain